MMMNERNFKNNNGIPVNAGNISSAAIIPDSVNMDVH